MNPRIATVARRARAVSPDTRVGFVSEILRMGPYRAVPVLQGERLTGMVTENDLLQALLKAADATARARVREMPVSALMTPPMAFATPAMRVSEAAVLFSATGAEALPVIDEFGAYLGMVGPSDLVRDLVRPFRPPVVGGMATPLGVYLTTGAVSGGAGTLALLLMGLVMFVVHLLCFGLGNAAQTGWTAAFGDPLAALPTSLSIAVGDVLPYILQIGLLLILLRLSPIAGYHAAEHQVVHALERAEPLMVETVRVMPRVHPRCGTNLVAGMMILLLGVTVLSPYIGEWSYLLSALMAFVYWRSLGGWLQQHFTTRPATDRQIESGIRAARELLDQHGRAPYAPTRPPMRLWRMGFLQIFSGFCIGWSLLHLAIYLSPWLHRTLMPYLGDLMLF